MSEQPCGDWKPAPGAAFYWCDNCGVRADRHPGSRQIGEALRLRLLDATKAPAPQRGRGPAQGRANA